jgi:hypothetical protein
VHLPCGEGPVERLGGAHELGEVRVADVVRQLERLANVLLEQHERIPAMPLVIPDDKDGVPHVGDRVRILSPLASATRSQIKQALTPAS